MKCFSGFQGDLREIKKSNNPLYVPYHVALSYQEHYEYVCHVFL